MSEEHKNNKCLFCKIIQGECPEGTILYRSDNIVVFKDIKPASDFHYLACPVDHIDNAKSLTIKDKPLLMEMKSALDTILERDDINLDEASFGFHWPPFHSIDHLHLHAIAPISKMKFFGRLIFKPINIWYCTLDYVLKRIDKNSVQIVQ